MIKWLNKEATKIDEQFIEIYRKQFVCSPKFEVQTKLWQRIGEFAGLELQAETDIFRLCEQIQFAICSRSVGDRLKRGNELNSTKFIQKIRRDFN